MEGTLSPADVAVLSGNAGNNNNGFGDNGAWWIILFLIFGWGRNGFGGYGNGGGVTDGYVKKLTLVGVGYRAVAQGKKLTLNVGYSHPVEFEAPEGITVKTPSATSIEIEGISKQVVGQFAAEIRDVRPPEPYKGKGIRYEDEYVRRKEGKTGK